MNSLFESKLITHKADPETSFEAADKMIKSGALSRQEKEVWNDICRYIYDAGHKDFTPKELAEWLMGDATKNYFKIQRRKSGLSNKGKIAQIQIATSESGEAIYKQRYDQYVWRIVEGVKL